MNGWVHMEKTAILKPKALLSRDGPGCYAVETSKESVRAVYSAKFSRMTIIHSASNHLTLCLFHRTACFLTQTKHLLISSDSMRSHSKGEAVK